MQNKPELVEENNDTAKPEAPSDPFDLNTLRLGQNFVETTSVKKLVTKVPVRKPNKQDFIRVHPDPNYRLVFALIELKDDRDEIYVVTPAMAQELPGECFTAVLYTVINRQGVVTLWPGKLPAPDGRVNAWHQSAHEAAERAMTRWVRVMSNMSLGAYEIYEASSTIPDPVWPELTYDDLVRIAFRGKVVNSFDHPIIKRLRG
jgi:hypothetical protein